MRNKLRKTSITVVKTALTTSLPEPGGWVTFKVDITNTSGSSDPVTINSLTDKIGAAVAYSPSLFSDADLNTAAPLPYTILPGDTKTVYFRAQVTGSAKTVIDVVTASGVDDEGTAVSANDNASVALTGVAPSITVVKTALTTSLPEPGGWVTFRVDIANTSVSSDPVTINSLTDKIGIAPSYNPTLFSNEALTTPAPLPYIIQPGTTKTVYFKAEVVGNPGDVIDVVTASGTDDENTPVSGHDDATVTITGVAPTVKIDKTANPLFVPENGGDVTFTFVIENTGNETITVTSIIDDQFGDLLAIAETANGNSDIVLAPKAKFTFSIVENLSSEDLADHVNIVTVIAIDDDQVTATDSDDATVAFSAIRLDKAGAFSSGDDEYADAGELITFTFTVTNPGHIALNNVVVTDPMLDNIVYVSGDTNEDEKLQSNETWIFTGTYAVTQADIDAGTVHNVAVASSDETDDDTDHETVILEQSPSLTIVKTVKNLTQAGPFDDLADLEEGETAQYRVVVTNTGNVTLNNVILHDDQVAPGTVVTIEGVGPATFDLASKINLGTMAPGASLTITYKYVTTVADVDEIIINTATASTILGNKEVLSVKDDATINVTAIPLAFFGITITKKVVNQTAGGTLADMASGFVGDTFTYVATITNIGDALLSDVVLTDDKAPIGGLVIRNSDNTQLTWANIGGIAGLVIGELQAGASMSFTYRYTAVTADEGDVIINVATVKAVYKPESESYEDVPLVKEADATITIHENPPQTGESNNSGTAIGLAMILAAIVALIFRRRYRRNQMEI